MVNIQQYLQIIGEELNVKYVELWGYRYRVAGWHIVNGVAKKLPGRLVGIK